MSKPPAPQDDAPDIHQRIRELRDDAFWVRERAAEALGLAHSPDAVAALLEVLDDATATVRERAAAALARIGSEQAINGLIHALGEAQATAVLARVGSNETVQHVRQRRAEQDADTLRQALRHDLYEHRWRAAQALWTLKGAQAIEDVIQALLEPAPAGRRSMRPEASPHPLSDGPDEYLIFDALSRQDFQTAWDMARDLVQMDAEYAAMVCERVLALRT